MSRQILTGNQAFSLWESCLRKIYNTPASVTVVTGEWKTGKTDFALYLTFDELKERLRVIEKIGTNIKVFKDEKFSDLDDRIVYVDNFVDFETFVFQDKKPKVFIFDEAIKSSPSRKAMSKLNTKWLEYVPELSKGKCHLIAITQAKDYTESLFLNPIWNRAEWHKINKTTVILTILKPRIEMHTFYDVPPTSLKFDPYRQAIWRMYPEKKMENLPFEVKIAFDYAHGVSSEELMQKYQLGSRMQAIRLIRKGIRILEQMISNIVTNEWKEDNLE